MFVLLSKKALRTVCKYLLRKKYINKDEYTFFTKSYPKGFHVYFKKLTFENLIPYIVSPNTLPLDFFIIAKFKK